MDGPFFRAGDRIECSVTLVDRGRVSALFSTAEGARIKWEAWIYGGRSEGVESSQIQGTVVGIGHVYRSDPLKDSFVKRNWDLELNEEMHSRGRTWRSEGFLIDLDDVVEPSD
jgi:hypothetical protein